MEWFLPLQILCTVKYHGAVTVTSQHVLMYLAAANGSKWKWILSGRLTPRPSVLVASALACESATLLVGACQARRGFQGQYIICSGPLLPSPWVDPLSTISLVIKGHSIKPFKHFFFFLTTQNQSCGSFPDIQSKILIKNARIIAKMMWKPVKHEVLWHKLGSFRSVQ